MKECCCAIQEAFEMQIQEIVIQCESQHSRSLLNTYKLRLLVSDSLRIIFTISIRIHIT
jgi:hypothetical protein